MLKGKKKRMIAIGKEIGGWDSILGCLFYSLFLFKGFVSFPATVDCTIALAWRAIDSYGTCKYIY